MVHVEPPLPRRELPEARVLLVPAILMAAATGAAVALVASSARIVVGVCGAVAVVLLLAVSAVAVRRGRVVRVVEAEHIEYAAYLERRLAAEKEVVDCFADEIAPAAFDRMAGGVNPHHALRELAKVDDRLEFLPAPLGDLLEQVMFTVHTEQAIRDSLARSFVDVARRIQAIVHQQAKELREMEEDHGTNPGVFDDLLRIDHGTSLIGRLADTVGVLGGGRPGRQWPLPVSLYSTLRGAMSRILEYRRIQLDTIGRISVKGIYVEPVIHACAELFDNATRYSPPGSKVHVNAVDVQTGIAIEIEDSGVNFNEEARNRVEGLLELAMEGMDIQDLDKAPRLGLAVVGRLCKTYSMQISLRPSAYGGVRAVLVVPHAMLTTERGVGLAHGIGATSLPISAPEIPPGPARTPKKRRPTAPKIVPRTAIEEEEQGPIITEWTPNGLPQRRSRVLIPPHVQRMQAYAAQEAAERAEREAAEQAEREGRPLPEPEPEPKDDRPPPGMWVEEFFEGLKHPPGEYKPKAKRTEEAASPVAEDERDSQ
ncbi:ATP-binding protein [Streptomyces sp. NPDC057877]|uniref:ATP-binding protein n=1 Tax=Streptomyces sp. NPDC057877 TaxID=3346269 RepID=UPI00367E8D21